MQPDFSAGHEHAASADDVTRVLRQIYVITLSLLQPGRQSSVVYTTPTFVALLPGCQTFLFAQGQPRRRRTSYSVIITTTTTATATATATTTTTTTTTTRCVEGRQPTVIICALQGHMRLPLSEERPLLSTAAYVQ